jgi:exonuclease III
MVKDENTGKNQRGNVIFCHGAHNYARGVMIMTKPTLDIQINYVLKDQQGLCIQLKCHIQGSPFNVVNIYAPNTETVEQNLYKDLKQKLRNNDDTYIPILGGDNNLIQDIDKDRKEESNNFL